MAQIAQKVRLLYHCSRCDQTFIVHSRLTPQQVDQLLDHYLYESPLPMSLLSTSLNDRERHICNNDLSVGIGDLIGYDVVDEPRAETPQSHLHAVKR